MAICVAAGVMYWGDAYLDRIETARTDGTGRRVLGRESRNPDYSSFLLRDGNIYATDWKYRYMYVCFHCWCNETVIPVRERGSSNESVGLYQVG